MGDPQYLRPRPRLDGPVLLVPYDAAWPRTYRVVRDRIAAALPGRRFAVDHVGSTSVPGLPAKPIIDMLLLVDDPADEDGYVPVLAAAGFPLHLREPAWFEHRLLRGVDPAVNVHVFAFGSPEAVRMLAFRDWLRSHPDDRDQYARVKAELAARTWDYVQDYADAKSDVIADILRRVGTPEPSVPPRVPPQGG